MVATIAGAPVAPSQTAVVVPPAKAQAAAPVSRRGEGRLERAAGAIDDGRFGDAMKLVEEILDESSLKSDDADWASYLKARALAGLGKTEQAEATVRERHRLNPNGYTWASLVAILATCGQFEEAASTILDLDEESLILANRLRPSVIESIVASLDGKAAGVRDKLIMRLVEGRYTGPASHRVPDLLRLRYVGLLLRQSRIEDAARQTQSLESPSILSILLTDKSFEPLWSHPSVHALMVPETLVARVDRGVQARLEMTQLSSSDWLDVMRSLRVIGRADEAVRLGLHALAQARKEKRAAGPALRLEVANAYADLGQSWAARRTARELLREEPSASASLRISIAQIFETTGDDEGALLLLSTLGEAAQSPYALKLAVCAAHDLGRPERRDTALAALVAYAKTAPAEVLDGYVCAGEKEKAAEVLAAMFARPELRSTAILTAQLYADPGRPGSDQNDMRYRMKALVASAAVQDAIKPFGRSIGLPFTIANARN